jgi:hypothetical protein
MFLQAIVTHFPHVYQTSNESVPLTSDSEYTAKVMPIVLCRPCRFPGDSCAVMPQWDPPHSFGSATYRRPSTFISGASHTSLQGAMLRWRQWLLLNTALSVPWLHEECLIVLVQVQSCSYWISKAKARVSWRSPKTEISERRLPPQMLAEIHKIGGFFFPKEHLLVLLLRSDLSSIITAFINQFCTHSSTPCKTRGLARWHLHFTCALLSFLQFRKPAIQ